MELPQCGLVFSPVGNGDSTTIVADRERGLIVQVDLNHAVAAEEDEDPGFPVIDELVDGLPDGVDGKKYLAVFALTHSDSDHCRGFERLLDEVTIGEIWFTPRVIVDDDGDEEINEHAQAFVEEARRRIDATIADPGGVASGDRVRIIGRDDLLDLPAYSGFPSDRLTNPGEEITELDGVDASGLLRIFVHSPFKEDLENSEVNEASLGMQVTLTSDSCVIRALLLGDLSRRVIASILDRSDADDLAYEVLLAPHHGSKTAVARTDDDGEENIDWEFVSDLGSHASDAYVVFSSRSFEDKTSEDVLPPHEMAQEAYETIVPDGQLVITGDHKDDDGKLQPIVFDVAEDCGYREGFTRAATATTIPEVSKRLRGGEAHRTTHVGYGAD